MIKLTNTPIFYKFLKEFLIFTKELKFDFDIEEELYITDFCKCTDKECATVYLKRNKSWKTEILGVYTYNTNNGFILIHFEEDGYLEFEALCYDDYPYKNEMRKVFNNQKKYLNEIKESELSDIYKKIDVYFNNSKKEQIQTIVIDN